MLRFKSAERALFALMAGAVAVFSPVSRAADPYVNAQLRFFYPDHDYCFQDHRSIRDIFAGRLPIEIVDQGDPDDPGPVVACFDRDNPPTKEIMDQVERAMQAGYGSRYQYPGGNNRWPGTLGDPVHITWSLVPDGVLISDTGPGGAANSELFSRMDSLFGGNRANWISKIQACFDRWAALTGNTYTRVTDGTHDWDDGAAWGSIGGPTRGDVRISMKPIDSNGGVLAYNQYPLSGGDMVLDRWDGWNSSANNYRFMRNIIMHEHGHGIGLAHVCPLGNGAGSWKLMEPYVNTAYDGPQQDDIRGAQGLYGDPFEVNDTAAAATVLGPLTPGVALSLGSVPSPTPGSAALLSISDFSDNDYYQLSLDRPRLVDITVTPVGSTYFDSQQAGDCQNGTWNSTNAAAACNLGFDVRASTGAVVYRTVNATAAGSAESTSGLLVGYSGPFLVRVYSAGSFASAQSYTVVVTARATDLSCAASDATFTDKVRITWPGAISDATGYQIVRATSDNLQFASTIATLGAGVLQFDDTTAATGTQYYYWVKAQQPGSTAYRYMTSSGEPGSRNAAPVANAGPDQTLTDSDMSGSEPVLLDGSASSDVDGTIAVYTWTEGATPLASSPDPTAIVPLAVGVHTVTLTVTDNRGGTGSDTVVVTVNQPSNTLPIANAGDDQAVIDSDRSGDETVNLDGSGSSDPDGMVVRYVWREDAEVLSDSALPTAAVTLTVGTHTITLTVSDNRGASASDSVQIVVSPPCAADYNNDGGVDGDDVSAFFFDWETALPNADVNADGGIDGGDISAFYDAWERGGC